MEWLLAIAVLGGIAYVAVQSNKFGGLTALVHQDLKQDRERLRTAQRTVKDLEGTVAEEHESAKRKVGYAQRDHERRVREATEALHELCEPGPGAQIDAVGSVRVFEHELRIAGQTHDIDGARASTETAPDSVLLVVELSSGQRLEERFTTRSTAPVDGQPTTTVVVEYSEAQVASLADSLNAQAQKREEFVRSAPSMIADAEQVLERERNDTSDIDAATAELEAVERGTEASVSLERARGDLETVERQYAAAVQRVKEQRAATTSGTTALGWAVGSTPVVAVLTLAVCSSMLALSAVLPWVTLGESQTGLGLSGLDWYPGLGGLPILIAGVVSVAAAVAALFGAGRMLVIVAASAAAVGAGLAVRELFVLLDSLPRASDPGVSFVPLWLYLGIGAGTAATVLGVASIVPLERLRVTQRKGSMVVFACAVVLAAAAALPWVQDGGESRTGLQLNGFEFYPGLGGQAILLAGILVAAAAAIAIGLAPRSGLAGAIGIATIAGAIAMREVTLILDQARGGGTLGFGLYGAVAVALLAIVAGSVAVAVPQTSEAG